MILEDLKHKKKGKREQSIYTCLEEIKSSWKGNVGGLIQDWVAIAGEQLALNCTPLNIQNKVLTIGASHPQWRQALQYNRLELIDSFVSKGVPNQQIIMTGHSCGGWLTMMLMSRHPDKVGGGISLMQACYGKISKNFKAKKNYKDQLKEARRKTNQSDSILVAHGKLDGMKVTCAAMSFSFIGGSLSINSGHMFVNGAAYAIENKTPFIVFSASGGARMQESMLALSQMTRTTLAVSELKKNNIPYIVVLTHPTSGAVTASFASLGDIAIGEPGATVGFAGARVIKDTVRETLPKSFQETEWHLELMI